MNTLRAKHIDSMHQEIPTANPTRFERKFYLPPSKIPFAQHLLVHCCPRDKQYPEGIVNSVYYDTSDLEFFCDSVDGNYIRNKVRIRWYDSPQQKCESTPVYLELKSKNGYAGSKQRKMHLVPSG